MSEPQTVGERIRAARRRRGRNKNQMARDLGTSWQHVDRWERGKTIPSSASLQRLATYLEVTVDYLLGTAPSVEGSEAFESFLAHYAPPDLTEAERRWLQGAPFGERKPSPGSFIDLLHTLRSAEAPEPAKPGEPQAKSGERRKVDRPDLLARLGVAANDD